MGKCGRCSMNWHGVSPRTPHPHIHPPLPWRGRCSYGVLLVALFFPYLRYIPEAVSKCPPTWPWQEATLPPVAALGPVPPGWSRSLRNLIDQCVGPAEARPKAKDALAKLGAIQAQVYDGNASDGETEPVLDDPTVSIRGVDDHRHDPSGPVGPVLHHVLSCGAPSLRAVVWRLDQASPWCCRCWVHLCTFCTGVTGVRLYRRPPLMPPI